MDTLEQVRERFANDLFATNNGAFIEAIDDGYSRCTMAITPDLLNSVGTVMGGAIFTLADFAFAVAANWNQGIRVSLSSQITFLGVARGNVLVAEARRIKEGRTTCYYEVNIKDDLDHMVAHMTINGFSKNE